MVDSATAAAVLEYGMVLKSDQPHPCQVRGLCHSPGAVRSNLVVGSCSLFRYILWSLGLKCCSTRGQHTSQWSSIPELAATSS